MTLQQCFYKTKRDFLLLQFLGKFYQFQKLAMVSTQMGLVAHLLGLTRPVAASGCSLLCLEAFPLCLSIDLSTRGPLPLNKVNVDFVLTYLRSIILFASRPFLFGSDLDTAKRMLLRTSRRFLDFVLMVAR